MLHSFQNKDIINFAEKWVKVENIILSEVPQTKRHTKYVVTEKYIGQKLQNTHDIPHRTHEVKQRRKAQVGRLQSHLEE